MLTRIGWFDAGGVPRNWFYMYAEGVYDTETFAMYYTDGEVLQCHYPER